MKGLAQKFLNKAIGNNGKPQIINIDKSWANIAGIKTWNKRSMTSKKDKDSANKVFKQYRGTGP